MFELFRERDDAIAPAPAAPKRKYRRRCNFIASEWDDFRTAISV